MNETEGDDAAIYERLRAWRHDRAKVDGVPGFVVMHDKVLRGIAIERPTSLQSLEMVEGIGPAKLERYGNEILDVVRQER